MCATIFAAIMPSGLMVRDDPRLDVRVRCAMIPGLPGIFIAHHLLTSYLFPLNRAVESDLDLGLLRTHLRTLCRVGGQDGRHQHANSRQHGLEWKRRKSPQGRRLRSWGTERGVRWNDEWRKNKWTRESSCAPRTGVDRNSRTDVDADGRRLLGRDLGSAKLYRG